MPMNDADVNAILLRADEIQRASVHRADEGEIRRFIDKAEASGYSREAVLQALRERFGVFSLPVAAGDRVFARTPDGKFHVATVVTPDDGAGMLRVRYPKGGEQALGLDGVRPFAMVPGERVSVHWPQWGAWSCVVLSYDADRDEVRLSDRWGSEKTFDVSEVWLEPPSKRGGMGSVITWGGIFVAGAVVGGILTQIVARFIP